MMSKEIIKRLLWREWRENWLFLLVGCGLPLAAGRIAQTYEKIDILGIVMLLTIMMILMQIAAKSYVIPGKPAKSRLLPVPVAIEFFSVYIIQAITPLSMGTALGVMMGMNTDIFTNKEALGMWIATFAVITLTCYLLIVLMSHVSNTIIFGLICGAIYLSAQMPYIDNTTHWLNNLVYPWFIVGIVISIIYWEICAHYRRIIIGRVLVAVIMAVSILYPVKDSVKNEIKNLTPVNNYQVQREQESPSYFPDKYSDNLIYHVKSDEASEGHMLVFENIETGMQRTHTFSEYSYPISISNDGTRVLLIQQRKGENRVHLLRWEPQVDAVTKIATIPCQWSGHFGTHDSVSDPKSGSAILIVSSPISKYENINRVYSIVDVWVIDAMQARAKMIVGKYFGSTSDNEDPQLRFRKVSWSGDQVNYFLDNNKYVVAFPSMNITKSELPLARIPQ